MSEDHRRRRRRHRHHGIGELPDEILIHILSFLSLEEASVTASLSSRWRYLWTVRSRLDFDISVHTRRFLYGIEMENGIESYTCDWIARNFEQEYVSWVNQLIAMRSRAGRAAVDEFSVGFCLNSKHALDINRWVVFAFSNGAKRLKLDFNDAEGKPNPCVDKLYNFPVDILLRYDLCSNGLDSLQSLCLKSVNIEYDDALESLISRCPTLESIVLANVGCLGSLRLLCLSRSSRLKKLELSGCHHLQRVQIFDIPSLVSLKLNPVPKDCYFDKLPRLVELAVVGGGGGNMEPLKPFSSVCSELKTLEISGMDARNISYNNQMKAVFRLTMLEKLLITVNECNGTISRFSYR
ncbi:Putative F-box/LRR-repeat protein At3g59230 [Linum perenne]